MSSLLWRWFYSLTVEGAVAVTAAIASLFKSVSRQIAWSGWYDGWALDLAAAAALFTAMNIPGEFGVVSWKVQGVLVLVKTCRLRKSATASEFPAGGRLGPAGPLLRRMHSAESPDSAVKAALLGFDASGMVGCKGLVYSSISWYRPMNQKLISVLASVATIHSKLRC